MNTYKSILLVVLLACGTAAHADVLMSWGDGELGTDYDWFLDNTLVILRGDGNDYKFWVHDGSGTPGTGVINNITVDPSATGDFSILIEHETGAPGALDWNEGDLRYAGGTSTVTAVKVAGVLAELGKAVALDRLDGSIEVGGSIESLKIATWLSGSPPWVIDVGGDVREIIISSHCFGGIFIGGDLRQLLEIGVNLLGNVRVDGNLVGDLLVQGGLPTPTASIDVEEDLGPDGTIQIASRVDGQISVGGDSDGTIWLRNVSESAYIVVKGSVSGSIDFYPYAARLSGTLDIGGDLLGSIRFWGPPTGGIDGGRIHIRGSLRNNAPGHEISAHYLINNGAIAIDYNGWHEPDIWDPNATVRIGTNVYHENDPNMHIWEIQPCKGDMNNNGVVDSEDPNWLAVAISDPNAYETEFPGLECSLWWHGDLNCDGERNEVDQGALAFFAGDPNKPCCQSDPNCAQYEACRADLDRSGWVDLPDLAGLLAAYGYCYPDPRYNPDADFDASNCVDLLDLAHLLGVYGEQCDCFEAESEAFGGGGFVPEGGAPPPIQVWFQAIDTGGYSGGGFHGEVDHFVFDLKVEVNDPNNDWTATGAVLPARNAATFRLSTSPTTPDAYATFVGAPWTTIPSGPGATQVIGAYQPPDLTYEFETTAINIGWYDTVDSENGPAAVMHLVIDVSAVEGADTSGGFGSVYFSQTGPANPEDILVADVESETGHCFGGCNMHPLSGNFYVKGE